MRLYRISLPEIDLDYLHDKHNRPDVGIGEWIFEDDRYKAWQEVKQSKLLWPCDGPGTGRLHRPSVSRSNFSKDCTILPKRLN